MTVIKINLGGTAVIKINLGGMAVICRIYNDYLGVREVEINNRHMNNAFGDINVPAVRISCSEFD